MGYFLYSNSCLISYSKENKVLYTQGVQNSKHENAIEIGELVYDHSKVNIQELCKMIREIASKTQKL